MLFQNTKVKNNSNQINSHHRVKTKKKLKTIETEERDKMSGGKDQHKVRSKAAAGWEEAGGEFYQESFPTNDLDNAMQRDPTAIATLLPSKQNRAGKFHEKIDFHRIFFLLLFLRIDR